jgi:hypothetical protein
VAKLPSADKEIQNFMLKFESPAGDTAGWKEVHCGSGGLIYWRVVIFLSTFAHTTLKIATGGVAPLFLVRYKNLMESGGIGEISWC